MKNLISFNHHTITMISSTNNEKIIADFQKKVDSLSTQKQLTFEEKKELVLKENDSLKRPSYHL
jgi:hypothetical protein